MKAALVTSLDGPAAVTNADIAEPVFDPTGDAVLVAVSCAGLNHSDVLRTRGAYQEKAELPFSPGGEIAGRVMAAPSTAPFAAGDRVMGYVGHGGARERLLVPTWRLVAIPPAVEDAIAAVLPITYGTALHALRSRTPVGPGDVMVVLGAGGGAGLAAIEIGRLLGARVIAVTSRDKHGVCLARGADATIDRETPDMKRAIRDLAGPAGPDCIYDCVGGDAAEPALRSLRARGRYAVVGFASRKLPTLPLDIVLVKEIDVVGINWPAFVARDPGGYRADMEFALRAVAERRLEPVMDTIFPLQRITCALDVLDRGAAAGKVAISML